MSDSVSAVIINYNGEAFLASCLDSLQAQSRPFEEIWVVDNASRDRSLDLLGSYADVQVLALAENVGYAEACNRGIEKTRGELVAVLNNDLVLDPRWLESLLRHNRPPWDFWASRILFAQVPDRIDSAGDGMAVVGSAYKIGHGDSAESHSQVREVFGPCGAAALYRRSLLEAVSGFDPDFFLVYEDADLNMRARLLGFRCLFVPEAKVFHRVNASIGALSPVYVFYGHRNSEFVFWKNMPGPLLLRYLPERLLFNLLCFLYFLLRGRAGSFLKAKWDFVRQIPGVWEKRRRIQASRRLAPADFRRLLDRNWLRYRRNVVAAPQ